MVVGDVGIHNIMGGMENTAGVRLHNHRRKLKQRFDIIRKLGQGTYGKVQLGINKETGQEVAIKTIKKAKIETEADLVRIRREIQIMSSVQHPNIIHIYEVFENREKMVLVMEYAAGGELYDYLSERKVLSEQEARRIFRQIATAVYYCHKHKICHRDLKLENILLDEHGSAKIADFGLSNVFDEQRLLNTFCGSPLYASPEIVKGTPYHGPEVDCWSLGVLLYTLVYGAMPFDGSNFKRLVKQISQGDYFEPRKPSPASPLIRDMLTVPPARRADIEKICSHWWVNEDCTESCLEIAEELANQTPVRLDLLLSLAPPAPSVGSDKLLITKEQGAGDVAAMGTTMIPARCHSVGSLMELDHPSTERRTTGFDKERLLQNEISSTEAPKRKLEEGISTEEANQAGSKRKERSRRRERDRSSDRRHHRSSSRNKHMVETNNKSLLESKDEHFKSEQDEDLMDVDTDGSSFALQYIDTSLRESEETITGSVKAAASSVETMAGSSSTVPEQEHVEVTLKSPTKEKGIRKPVKKKCKAGDESEVAEKPSVETSNEKDVIPSQIEGDVKDDVTSKARKKKQVATEAEVNESSEVLGEKETLLDPSSKENDTVIDQSAQELKDNKDSKESQSKGNAELNVVSSSTESNIDVKERVASKPTEIPKKGVKTRKSKGELSLGKLGSSSEKSSGANTPDDTASPPTRPMERRRSKIFETAEKFNSLLSGSSEPKSPTTEKPKKVFIPGVKVSDAKRAFERKSSLPEATVPTLSKNSVPKKVPEVNSDATLKGTCQDNTEVSLAQKGEKKPTESNLLEIKEKDQNGAKSNSGKNQQSLTSEKGNEKVHPDAGEAELKHEEEDTNLQLIPALPVTDKIAQQEEARIKKLKDAVEIISNAIAEESKKEGLPDSNKKVSSSKPPVPASADSKGRIKGIGVSGPTSPKSPPPSPLDPATGKKTVRVQVAPNDVRLATIQVSTPEATKFPFNESDITKGESVQGAGEVNGPAEDVKSETVASKDSKSVEDSTGKKKSAKVEITLKSATLPRRKTSKAEIQLGSPAVPPVEFKTEVEHMVGTSLPTTKPTQRSEVAFPIAGVSSKTSGFRSMSSEPDEIPRTKPRERIIPIKLEDSTTEAPSVTSPPPARPPVPPLQTQRSLSQSQRSGSLSRQSTQDSDTEGPDTIHKSPREFIIPIAVEGGGYVTPRAGSLEPSASDESTSRSRQRSSSRFGRPRRMSSLLSDASEDEGFNSPFATLQRHSSLGRDDDDDKSFHMHRLRSSRPSRHPLEHADSLSSAEEDDDDDGFEILTAESLFSTLLSRVRSLTQRLNVEDASRPGFPSSRLMNQLKSIGHTSPSSFWNNVYTHQQEPLSRRLSESSQFSRSFSRDSELNSTPWRRSASRDVSDCDSVYSETSSTTGTLPRGSARQEDGGMCDEAASETSSTASSFPSHYTPSLARRISHHYKHRSADEELGGQAHSNINALQSHDDLSRREYLSSVGNPLSYLPSHDAAHYIPSSSRRLARTLSMRSATEERSRSGSRRREYVPPRRLSFLESRDIRSSGELYNKSSFHGSSHSDIDEYKKRDYLPPTRRTLRLLDNNSSSGLNHRGSSASDTGEFYTHKPWDTSSVLPPLPHNALSYSRRKDSTTTRSYGRQRSADIIDSSYGSQLNRHVPARIVEAASEDIHDRPKHSASLPSMVGGKGSGFKIKGSTHLPVSGGIQSGHSQRQSKPDNHSNENVLSNSVVNNELTSTKENIESSTNISKPVEFDISERNHISENDLQKDDDSEKRNRSQIPSLLRFRSSSLCRETGVSKSRNTGSEDDRTSQSIPDRSILSKFFRHGSEERSTGKDDFSTENKEGTDGKKKTRRISRFLRPDFFDTPREESSFVKEKEAQKAAEEEKKKAKRIARRAALLEKKEKEAQKLLNDRETLKNDCLEQTSNDKDDTYSEIQPSVKETSLQTGGNDEDNSDAKFTSKSSDNTTTSNTGENAVEKSGNGTNNKNRFLHSLEKKWEKFKSSGDDSNSAAPCGKSRVEKAIRSLRERSVAPRGSDLMTTESNLLKRAVSVDDMCTKAKVPVTKGNNSSSSKLGSKVSSVLGLFRKMEDSPTDVQKLPQAVNRPSLLLSRLRRTQSVYAGSHSDSVLHAHYQEMLDTSASAAVVSESQGKDHANEFTESKNDSILNDVNLNSKTQKTVDSPVENITIPTSAGIVIANPSTNVVVQNAEKSQKTHIKPITSEIPNGTSSNKVLGKTKVVKETSHQKEGVSLEKQKSGSTGISETSKSVSSKPSVVRKSNPKKAIGSYSSSKVASGISDTQKVKSPRLLDDGKDLVKCVKDVSKFDGKKGSPHRELLHNTQNIEENQQIVEKSGPPPLPTAASQGGSVICEKEIKVPELKASVTLEPNEPHTEKTTELIHETGSMQNKGAEASLLQTSDTKRESEEESHESANPKSEVDSQNCKKTPVLPLTHDAAGHKLDVSHSEGCMVDLGCESAKSSLSPCIDSVNANEMKVAVVKKLDCCSKPSEEIATPVLPIDECESLDSWSVCSDFESRDFSMSPLPYPNVDEEETESVEDRIRRKSFYSRFNDIKKKSHRKLSPSYVGTQNFSAQQHYKNQGNHSLYSPQDLGYHVPSYSKQTSLPRRSHSAINNSTSTDNESQSYELHNGFDDSSRDQKKESLEESIKTDKYLNSEEQKVVQTVPPSNKSSRSLSHSDVDKQLKTGPSHLLRPTDFTQDVIRRSSLSKSRLPTASWERRASTPVGSRLAILSNKSARASKQADTTAPEGENLPLDGKYDRFTSESSPSS